MPSIVKGLEISYRSKHWLKREINGFEFNRKSNSQLIHRVINN
jgi:hypothetical protein